RRVERLFRRYVAHRADQNLDWSIETLARAPAVLFNRNGDVIRAAACALRHSFSAEPALLRSGGSIPILGSLHRVLRAPVAMMGFGLPADAIHSSNESFSLAQFARARSAAAAFLSCFRMHRKRRFSEAADEARF